MNLLKTLLDSKSEDFAPMVAVMYAGDHIAASDVGMRSRAVWQPWFCAYNVEMETHSPGILHLIEMMNAAPQIGVRRIDLGAGGEPYNR